MGRNLVLSKIREMPFEVDGKMLTTEKMTFAALPMPKRKTLLICRSAFGEPPI